MTDYVIEKRVLVQAHAFSGPDLEAPGLPRSRQVCYVCYHMLPDLVLEVRVFCRRCGSDWEGRSADVCGEECAEIYATTRELDPHHTIGEKGSRCSVGREGYQACRGGCGRWVPVGMKCFDCASTAVDEWIARSFGRRRARSFGRRRAHR